MHLMGRMNGIIEFLVFLVILVFVVKLVSKKAAENGDYDKIIQQLEFFYDRVRNYHEQLGGGVVCISTYWFEIDGRADSSSALMSVCMHNGINDELAESIGMNVSNIGGTKYYQFVPKGGFRRAQKQVIVKRLAEVLAQDYHNDIFEINESIPAIFAMVDQRDIIISH